MELEEVMEGCLCRVVLSLAIALVAVWMLMEWGV